jgi:hypothetical protein
MRMARKLLVAGPVLSVMLVAIAGHARGEALASAEALFREGKALLEAGDHDAACPKLEHSQRLDPAIGTLALLAFCHEQQGKLATAWQQYLSAAAMARDAGQRDRERVARARAADLDRRLSRLTIVVEQPLPGLELRRSGHSVRPAEWGLAVPVDPGSIEIEARAPGYQPWQRVVQIEAGPSSVALRVPPLEPVAQRQPNRAPPEAPGEQHRSDPTDETSWLGRNAVAMTALGVGGVGIALGTFFGLRARAKHGESEDFCGANNQCTDRGLGLREEALDAATVSTIAFGAGLIALGTGVVLLVASGSQSSHPRAELVILPPSGRSPGSLGVRGRF